MKIHTQIAYLPLWASLLVGCGSPNSLDAKPEVSSILTSISEQSFYLRGGFNNWSNNAQFRKVDNNLWQAELNIKAGNHAFKIAPQDWSQEWAVNSLQANIISLEEQLSIAKYPAGDSYLFVKTPGRYRFEINLSQAKAPTLIVNRIADIKNQYIDPHAPENQAYQNDYTTGDGEIYQAKYSVTAEKNDIKSYLHSTTQPLRDNGDAFSHYAESTDMPRVRSGNTEFDALFSLAINEMTYLSVDSINDSSYNQGKDISCKCFKTGEKWAYVWTRDLAYAADLSLAFLAPERVKNSLNYKLSTLRSQLPIAGSAISSGLHIVQDTGSGGSWPISTDRMTWALGAEAVLNSLVGESRQDFALKAFTALKNSIEVDRLAVFDSADGLYNGEQSFLDWRQQTYAPWIVNDLASMASAKALSTNVVHYQALKLAQRLAKELGHQENVQKYEAWASALKTAINKKLWLPSKGLYSSLTAGHFDIAPLEKYDWLGQSLAILTGVADEQQAQAILTNYPHGSMGAPVIFPQQPLAPVYHNRAIWPFVTTYGLNAATKTGHSAVANAAYQTLIQAAALNISNMENLEWLTGQPLFLDHSNPWHSGPVINSKYQLWSVAGYLNMVVNNIFGIKVENQALHFSPFITTKLKQDYFANANVIQLFNLTWHNKTIDLEVRFPEKSQGDGYYDIESIFANGKELSETLTASALADHNKIVIQLGQVIEDKSKINLVASTAGEHDANVVAPVTPMISHYKKNDSQIKITLENQLTAQNQPSTSAKLSYSLIKNGLLIADKVSADELIDNTPTDAACYSVKSHYETGTSSHHSSPLCLGKRLKYAADSSHIASNKPVSSATESLPFAHIANWGAPQDSLKINQITLASDGKYAIQLEYINTSNTIGEGVTSGVKKLQVFNADNQLVNETIIHLPHTLVKGEQRQIGKSTPALLTLKKGIYRVEINDFFNMSYLTSNQTYGRAGGVNGPRNHFDFLSLQLLELDQ